MELLKQEIENLKSELIKKDYEHKIDKLKQENDSEVNYIYQ